MLECILKAHDEGPWLSAMSPLSHQITKFNGFLWETGQSGDMFIIFNCMWN